MAASTEDGHIMTPIQRNNLDHARARFACDAAAFALGCDAQLLIEGRGNAQVAFARQVAMYLTHVAFGLSLQRVATAFLRDRSTVAYACHAIEDRRDDPKLDDMLDQLEASLRAAPMPVQQQFKLAA
jgi:Bacterial dnaA protein helix-turn-helix